MQPVEIIRSLRSLLALDARVGSAQRALQRSRDGDPAIERRIQELMRLLELRTRAMAPHGR
jgi:hypothetical protein